MKPIKPSLPSSHQDRSRRKREITGEVIVQGKLDGNLYKIEAAVEEPEEKAELADTKALDDLMLWHARMGHLGWDALKRLEKADRGVDVGGTERPNEICQSWNVSTAIFVGQSSLRVAKVIISLLCLSTRRLATSSVTP